MIKDFWFYDSFMNMDLALNEWDYFREGFVRPFGFFSNTLSLAFFVSSFSLVLAFILKTPKY